MLIEEIVGSGWRFSSLLLWVGIPIVKTKLSLYHHGFEESINS